MELRRIRRLTAFFTVELSQDVALLCEPVHATLSQAQLMLAGLIVKHFGAGACFTAGLRG